MAATSILRVVSREFALYVAGRVGRIQDLGEDHIRGYIDIASRIYANKWRRPMPLCYRKKLLTSLHTLFRYLKEKGLHPGFERAVPRDVYAVLGYRRLLKEYENFLTTHRGIKPKTAKRYVEQGALLCQRMVDQHVRRWGDFSPRILYDHLRMLARDLGHLNFAHQQTALRVFFKFLKVTGKCAKDYSAWLVHVRNWRLGRVPRTIEEDHLYRLFESLKGRSHGTLRDRAVFLLLTFYGLRIGEIVRLHLEDIRWGEGKIILRQRKAGKDLCLPLHPLVAAGLKDYIENARPVGTAHREVFLTLHRGGRPYVAGHALASTLRYRLQKIGLRVGPHTFRHTLASRLLNNGCRLEWIQQILGHARIASTQIYTKVDLTHLREVAANYLVVHD